MQLRISLLLNTPDHKVVVEAVVVEPQALEQERQELRQKARVERKNHSAISRMAAELIFFFFR